MSLDPPSYPTRGFQKLPEASNLPEPGTNTQEAAHKRVVVYFGHAKVMVMQIENQYRSILDSNTQKEFEKVKGQLDENYISIQLWIDKQKGPLTKHDIKDLKKQLKQAEEDFARGIKVANRQLRAALTTQLLQRVSQSGGQPSYSTVRRAEKDTKEHMRHITLAASSQTGTLSTLDSERKEEAKTGARSMRHGVVKVGNAYRFEPKFKAKSIKKQWRSFLAQNLGDIPRTVIVKKIPGETLTSMITPLNEAFDEKVGSGEKNEKGEQVKKRVFGPLFGNKGISSNNRQEAGHVVNAFCSELTKDGQVQYRAFRHAILSDKFEKNLEVRKENNLKAAKELLKAVVMQQIEGREPKDVEVVHLTSLSLLTPDLYRKVREGKTSERTMLDDQLEALKKAAKDAAEGEVIEIDGKKIKVDIQLHLFNFGVNPGVTHAAKFGLDKQYAVNKEGWKGLAKHYDEVMVKNTQWVVEPGRAKLKDDLDALKSEIDALLQDPAAYTKASSPVEVGAKIICFVNLFDRLQGEMGLSNPQTVAMNCKSGKDRTGGMDAVAKAMMLYFEREKHFPSTRDLLRDPAVREAFGKDLANMYINSGSVEVAEVNTGARGLKVTSPFLFGILPQSFNEKLRGLGDTTESE